MEPLHSDPRNQAGLTPYPASNGHTEVAAITPPAKASPGPPTPAPTPPMGTPKPVAPGYGPSGTPTVTAQPEDFPAEDDRNRIRPPTEQAPIPMDQMVTIREHPPRFAPPSVFMRPAWIRAGFLVGIPALFAVAVLVTSRRPPDPMGTWQVAAVAAPETSVVLRTQANETDWVENGGVTDLIRQGGSLVAMRLGDGDSDGAGQERWRFPAAGMGSLIGDTLDASVLWIPSSGPLAPRLASAIDPAVLVLWTNAGTVTRHVRLSLLDRQGKEVWTVALDPDVGPDRFSWVPTATGVALAYQPPGSSLPTLYSIETGKPLPPRR